MFIYLEYLTTLDLSDIRTRYTTDMNRLFKYDRSITKLDLSNFDTSNVTDMSNMFYNMKKLESIDVSGFDTSNVAAAKKMFYNNRSLTSLDLSTWNTSKFENYNVLVFLPNLKELDISSFEITSERYINNYGPYDVFETLLSLERLKTPKSFTGDSSATLPAVFTDKTNNYVVINSNTPTSTWIERTNLISFKVYDGVNCHEETDTDTEASYSKIVCDNNKKYENIMIAEDGMTFSEWLTSSYNTEGYTMMEDDVTCPDNGNTLWIYNQPPVSLGSNNKYNAIRMEASYLINQPIKSNGIYIYVPCSQKDTYEPLIYGLAR